MKTFCILPAYNEEKNIVKTIEDVSPFVDEIIVVDDCSTDNTFSVAKKTNATVLRHLLNRGQGASLQTGNEYAIKNSADIIVHFDADGQMKADEIKDIILPLQNGDADIVFGSRFLEKKSDMPWFKEKIIMPIAHFVNKILIGKTLTDPQSGFRAMTRDVAKIVRIENDGAAHCSEILHKSFKNNLKIKEIPMTVIYNDFGQGILGSSKTGGRGRGGMKILKDLIISKLLD